MAHLDEPQKGEAPGEDTNVFVQRMLESRGKTRRPMMIGVGVLAVLLTLMALNFGSHRHQDLEIMGPVYVARPHSAAVPEAPQAAQPTPEITKSAGPPCDVEIVLEMGGNLMVDGRDLGGKEKTGKGKGDKARTHHLQLTPGPHSITVRQDGRVLTQKITVAPNEAYEVKFAQKIRVMKQAQ